MLAQDVLKPVTTARRHAGRGRRGGLGDYGVTLMVPVMLLWMPQM